MAHEEKTIGDLVSENPQGDSQLANKDGIHLWNNSNSESRGVQANNLFRNIPPAGARFRDDVPLGLGTGDDYWFEYESANTRVRLRSADIDGGGTTGDLLRVSDGTQEVESVGPFQFSDKVTFSEISAPSHSSGQVYYDTDLKTLSFDTDRSGVTVNIGEETVIRARNSTGSQISNGDIVYISGFHASSGLPEVSLAKADAEGTALIAGMATQDISNNSEGYIASYGIVRGLDLSAYNNGDEIWLSSSSAGAITTTEPSDPNFSVKLGTIARAVDGNGEIRLNPDTRRPALFTSGSVLFANSNGRTTQDNSNFFWDDTNDRLGLGTSSPQETVDVRGTIGISQNWILDSEAEDSVERLRIQGAGADDPAELFIQAKGSSNTARYTATPDSSTSNFSGITLESDGTSQIIDSIAKGTASSLPLDLRMEGTTLVQLTTSNTVQFSNITGTPTMGGHDHSESGMTTIPNSGLSNSSVTVAGNSVSLGGSTSVAYVDLSDTGSSFPIPNSDLSNSSVTVAGNSVSLGGSTAISVADLSDAALPNGSSAGQLLIWNSTNNQFENSTLTEGNNIAITNGDGSITVGLSGTLAKSEIPSATAYTDESNTFSSDQTVNADVISSGFYTRQDSVGDDGFVEFSPNRSFCHIHVDDGNAEQALVRIDLSTPSATAVSSTTNVEVTTGDLTGTTGTDGNLVISADGANSQIDIENRTGASRTITTVVLG